MTAVEVREPAPPTTGPLSPAGVRLAWLHLRSRRVPSAIVALAVCGAALRAGLAWHWTIGGSRPAATELAVIIEACVAAVIAVTTHSPFGEPERATGRWLPYLRFGVAVTLCGIAIGALALGALAIDAPGTGLADGILPVARNVMGFTGVGLLTALVTGGLLAWTGPLGYMAISQFALIAYYQTPLTWAARPPTDRGGWIAAMIVFAAGLALFTLRGARDRPAGDA